MFLISRIPPGISFNLGFFHLKLISTMVEGQLITRLSWTFYCKFIKRMIFGSLHLRGTHVCCLGQIGDHNDSDAYCAHFGEAFLSAGTI